MTCSGTLPIASPARRSPHDRRQSAGTGPPVVSRSSSKPTSARPMSPRNTVCRNVEPNSLRETQRGRHCPSYLFPPGRWRCPPRFVPHPGTRSAHRQRGPDALIVASHAAPRLPSAATPIESADDLALATTLSQFGGLPAEILARPERLALRSLSSATTCAPVAATAAVATHRHPARSISAAATASPRDPRRPHRLASAQQPTEARHNRAGRRPPDPRPPSCADWRDHVGPRRRPPARRRAQRRHIILNPAPTSGLIESGS